MFINYKIQGPLLKHVLEVNFILSLRDIRHENQKIYLVLMSNSCQSDSLNIFFQEEGKDFTVITSNYLKAHFKCIFILFSGLNLQSYRHLDSLLMATLTNSWLSGSTAYNPRKKKSKLTLFQYVEFSKIMRDVISRSGLRQAGDDN